MSQLDQAMIVFDFSTAFLFFAYIWACVEDDQ